MENIVELLSAVYQDMTQSASKGDWVHINQMLENTTEVLPEHIQVAKIMLVALKPFKQELHICEKYAILQDKFKTSCK